MEKIALNYALMIEKLRSEGVSNDELIQMLENEDEQTLSNYGKGMPDWSTFIHYYHNQKDKMNSAILDGYRITFLTKGSLKRLLKFKYNLEENEDFQDRGEYLDDVKMSDEALESLKATISMNWKIIDKPTTDKDTNLIKIELFSYEPITK